MHGTYETVDGRPALRFERRLAHPVERVWRAVTEPGELSRWFPAAVDVELCLGATVTFTFAGDDGPPTTGEVVALEPPHRFAFTWGEEELRFELEPVGDGCRLRFTHVLSERDQAARDAAGWHVCLDVLGRLLDGVPTTAPGGTATAAWRSLYEAYVEQGVPSGAPVPR